MIFDKNDEIKNWKTEKFLKKQQQQQQIPTTNLDLGKLEAGDYQLELLILKEKTRLKRSEFQCLG
jgi:hypothetical protein